MFYLSKAVSIIFVDFKMESDSGPDPGSDVETLDLAVLTNGEAPGLTTTWGSVLVEVIGVCLNEMKHVPKETALTIRGDEVREYRLSWDAPSEQAIRANLDPGDATELGACGIAIAAMRHLRRYLVLTKARKGIGLDKGCDYWLRPKKRVEEGNTMRLPQEGDVRLEVSGILRETSSLMRQRVRAKIEQLGTSTSSNPGVAVIVGFKSPEARVKDT